MFTDLDNTAAQYSGFPVDWGSWDAYLDGVVCRCAKASNAKGFNLFGIENFGEYNADNCILRGCQHQNIDHFVFCVSLGLVSEIYWCSVFNESGKWVLVLSSEILSNFNLQGNVGQEKVPKTQTAKTTPLNTASLRNLLNVIQKVGKFVVETKQPRLSTIFKRITRVNEVNIYSSFQK